MVNANASIWRCGSAAPSCLCSNRRSWLSARVYITCDVMGTYGAARKPWVYDGKFSDLIARLSDVAVTPVLSPAYWLRQRVVCAHHPGTHRRRQWRWWRRPFSGGDKEARRVMLPLLTVWLDIVCWAVYMCGAHFVTDTRAFLSYIYDSRCIKYILVEMCCARDLL